MDFNAKLEVFERDNVGDIFTHTDGHRYKVTKKTRTAIAVKRQYFYNDWFNKIASKFGGGSAETD